MQFGIFLTMIKYYEKKPGFSPGDEKDPLKKTASQLYFHGKGVYNPVRQNMPIETLAKL
ncbi:Uncharacterized protein dnm_019020 [Desulfonema magnum]|uniref:Uncharacterized protein n=1 Tax=Desulfonema magnum TaxID=45655 RepID=A0A975GLI7_9BACT|nr:Uncharacterized protein dnm_019020 [Desulfonema magnum]